MKILISDKAYEEYREQLNRQSVVKKEELEKRITIDNILFKEIDVLMIWGISVILYIFAIIIHQAVTDKNILSSCIITAPAFFMCIAGSTLFQVYCFISDYRYQKKYLDEVIDACENLSPDEFIKYLQQNYKSDYRYMEELLYLKNHPEFILKTCVKENDSWIYIDYIKGGKVETARFIYNSKDIRTDIKEGTLAWENGKLKLTVPYINSH